jgi:hypothetical protein
MPAPAHDGQGQEYPCLTVAVRQGSFTHRSPCPNFSRERGSLAAGGSPASLGASNCNAVAFVDIGTVRVLALYRLRAWGLGAVRKVATQTPSPRPQRL